MGVITTFYGTIRLDQLNYFVKFSRRANSKFID